MIKADGLTIHTIRQNSDVFVRIVSPTRDLQVLTNDGSAESVLKHAEEAEAAAQRQLSMASYLREAARVMNEHKQAPAQSGM